MEMCLSERADLQNLPSGLHRISLSFLFFKQIIKEIKEKAVFIKPEMDGVWKILWYTKTL